MFDMGGMSQNLMHYNNPTLDPSFVDSCTDYGWLVSVV